MTTSAWAVPTCDECKGVATDNVDGSECPSCSGTGLAFYKANSVTDRAEVAKQFVQSWGALTAMGAVGFRLGISDPSKRDDLDRARAEWATVFADAFGTSAEHRVRVGMLGVTTLAAAMRDAVAEAAVRFCLENRDEESVLDDLDLDAVKTARRVA